MQRIKILLILVLNLNFVTNLTPIFDLQKITGNKGFEFTFPTNIQAKNKELEKLETQLKEFQTKSLEANKLITNKLNNIQEETIKTKNQIKTAPQTDILNKKINLLSNRKQNLTRTQDLYKETEEIINNHIKIVNEIISNLQEKFPKPAAKLVYVWKELKQAQTKIAEDEEKNKTEKVKIISLNKQKFAEKENLNSLQKQKIKEENERKKLLDTKERPEEKIEDIAIKAAVLDQELKFLEEKINYSNLKTESLDLEINLRESSIQNLNLSFDKTKKELVLIEKRLVLGKQDVQTTKIEWENESKKSLKIKNRLTKKREFEKKEKDEANEQLENAEEEVKQGKEEGDQANIYFLESKQEKIKQKVYLSDKEIKLIDIKKELQDNVVQEKKLAYQTIKAYYEINKDKETITEFLQNFKNQKNQSETSVNLLKDKQREASSLLAQASRDFDFVKAKIEEIKNNKDTVFKNKIKIYNDTLINYDETKKLLGKKSRVIQNYQAVISDLIGREEKILNQYIFVINNLEAKYVSISIWKRSPKAITFSELSNSIDDIEKFFKKLFWDTPDYLGPTSILKTIKNLDFYNYLSLILFLLFFIVFLILLKIFLRITQSRIQKKLLDSKQHYGYLYLEIAANSLLEFTLNNFTLIFSWVFIHLHIVFNFRYIFSLLKPLANPYSITIFYLVSIPVLIYLSSQLIGTIKTINKKLGLLFFSETSQIKFLFLIKTILYSTSILLPFRKAFLTYIPVPTNLPNVIIAAYSLILVIVILLFFWKEDVLALLPAEQKFFIWLKTKISKYYYPVFIFLMGLFLLSNPYIGYSNLAWYLAFAVPSSLFLIYGIFFFHHYIRKYSTKFFLQEEDDEIKDRFDHAKTYYGFFVVTTFLSLIFFGFILLARIWGFIYSPAYLWQLLSQEWVITISPEVKLGIVQFLMLAVFIAGGFIASSFAHRFVFNKLFNIFRTEPGTQNTIFRIFHYTMVCLAVILGFFAIGLPQFILTVSGLLALGVGFGIKDLVTDFIAGFIVLIERPIEIGNYIEIDEKTRGTVHQISARVTTIRTARNFSLIIPNKDLISKPITNWGIGRLAVGFELNILVEYSTDPELVKKVLQETIENHQLILKIPGITIRLEDFQDNGMLFFVRAFISSRRVRDQWTIASDIRFAIVKSFRENNIVIPFPQHVLHFAKNNSKSVKAIDIKFDQPELK